ncbi:MAG TPA: MSMEG_0567/Sll0786 family nitrogen starvation N-acetyltransferase [Solirubrobacter sp.]|nr:MSMEG_0567/Sll0786 family nitrogen starvation N-acetyltransferase [Solirubrobacter sp.]
MVSSSAPAAEIVVASDLEAHFAVRRRVFVELQGLFETSDRDEVDALDDTVHVVAVVDGSVVGTVRLYPLGDGLWKGDRLAVLPEARVHRLGAALVQFAVRTGLELGGTRMVAQVQVPNVRFFERLGWTRDGAAALYRGVMHQPMAIALSR